MVLCIVQIKVQYFLLKVLSSEESNWKQHGGTDVEEEAMEDSVTVVVVEEEDSTQGLKDPGTNQNGTQICTASTRQDYSHIHKHEGSCYWLHPEELQETARCGQEHERRKDCQRRY